MRVTSDLSVSSTQARLKSQWRPDESFNTASDGIWYDISDLSTLIADPAATQTPQPGDPIAIVLDKSRGLSLGPELIENGDFTTDTTGWSKIGYGIAFTSVDGHARLSGGDNIGGAYQDIALGNLDVAEIRFRIKRTSGSSRVRVRVYDYGGFAQLRYTLLSDVIDTEFTEYRFLVPDQNGGLRLYFQQAEEFGDAVIALDSVSVRVVQGNHAVQSNLAARPTLQQSAGGVYSLYFDGIDDFLQTGTLQPGSDKMQLVSVFQKESDSAKAVAIETSSDATLNDGTLSLMAPDAAAGNNYRVDAGGTSKAVVTTAANYAAPTIDTVTALGDIAGSSLQLRMNGVLTDTTSMAQGTGNFLDQPLFVGKRGNNSLPFDGALSGVFLRFGENLSLQDISRIEKFLANAAGAQL